MADRKIVCDKTEIILADERKKGTIHNLTYDQIIQIVISKTEESSWFKPTPSEKIEIFARKYSEPFIFLKGKNKQFFDEYKNELQLYAKANRITFSDLTGSVRTEDASQPQTI